MHAWRSGRQPGLQELHHAGGRHRCGRLIASALVFERAVLQAALADHHGAKPNIVGVAAGNADFSTLVTAVKAADLVGTLSGAGPFTVFAPTNAAFGKLPAGTVQTLVKPENKATLTNVTTKDRVFSLGYDYFLSKRTDVYAVFSNNTQSNTVANESGQTFAVGIKHAF